MDPIKKLCDQVDREKMWDTISWLTENTPYRLAGSENEARAAGHVCDMMRNLGLEVKNEEFYTYNSDPVSSFVEVIEPVKMQIESLPCAHIRQTDPEGEVLELIYSGDGSYAAYKDKDVRGKMVLVEVSYAPPVPEKARIASEMGAAGIMCMNWGNDEEVICHRGLKAVWGNPTQDTVGKIPDIIGIGITRNAGLSLKKLCLENEHVKIRVCAAATRTWSEIHQPMGILRGNGETDEFLLVCSHLDAWQPGVTCNATGNATLLEIARILSQNRDKMRRDICFVFWDGHEIAEAAGSTWFVDNYWDKLNKRCVSYMHIDSTGVSQTKIYEIKASEELLDFARDNYVKLTGVNELRCMALGKIGDQSCMGIGIPSVTQRMSFTKEAISANHGATLGWWNHTCEDNLDKCDLDILETDTKVTLSLIFKLATAKILPYDIDAKLAIFEKRIHVLNDEIGTALDLSDLLSNIAAVRANYREIYELRNSITDKNVNVYNKYVMSICRYITNVIQTYSDKYQQDSYGYTKLSYPIPLFADASKLALLAPDSFEYGLIHTQLVKNRNRINDALYQVIELTRLAKLVLANNIEGETK